MIATRQLTGAPGAALLWAYLGLLGLAELLTAATNPQVGLTLHALLLVGLLAHSGLGRAEAERRLALGLALAPLIRLLSLGLPLVHLPQLAWYPLVAAPLLAATFVIIRQVRISRAELGLSPGNLPLQLMLMGGGMGLGVAEYLILKPEPLLANFSWGTFVLGALVLLVATGFTEELIFRGLLQSLASPALGRWALLYVSLLFAVLHIGYLSLSDVLFVFAVGLLFAYIVRWGGSILGVTLAHGLTNTTLFLVMPYLGDRATAAMRASTNWLLWCGTALALVAIGVLWMRTVEALVVTGSDAPSGSGVRALRRESGLTYVALAERSGLPARLIAEIEHGMRPPQPEELSLLARALGVAPQSLGAAPVSG